MLFATVNDSVCMCIECEDMYKRCDEIMVLVMVVMVCQGLP